MHVKAAVISHGGKTAPDLVGLIDNCLKGRFLEARESKFAARFGQLLGAAGAQIVGLGGKVENLLFVVHSVERFRSHRAVESAGALQNIGQSVTENDTGMH